MFTLGFLFFLTSCGKNEAVEEDYDWEEPVVNDVIPGEMVFIPAGEFIMGTDNKTPDDVQAFPERKMKLDAFWMDKYEVTNEEFWKFSRDTEYLGEGVLKGHDWRTYYRMGVEDNVPVVFITWKDADTYCKANGKRLPLEAEWEYAARGPNGNKYPWGNEWEDGHANTSETGRRAPADVGTNDDVSHFGAHDMLGNVQEWTESWYETYPGGVADPNSGKKFRVVRGLSPNYRGQAASLWSRFAQPPTALFNYGFRCARNATPEEIASNQ